MTIVKSIREVDIRMNSPVVSNSNRKGILYPGFDIDAIDKVEGQDIEGNKIWYKDKNGDYYWSGGFEEQDSSRISDLNQLVDYQKIIQLSSGFLTQNGGDKVNVGILDTGIYQHPDLDPAVIQSSVYLDNITIQDNIGHGTHMAGLIGGRSNSVVGIRGIAPKCKLTSLKVVDEDKIPSVEAVKKALNEVISGHEKYDILNLSFDINYKDFRLIKELLDTINNLGIVMVGSAGNAETLLRGKVLSPANHDKVLAVGTIEGDNLDVFKTSGFNKKVNYFFLNDFLMSTLSLNNEFNKGKKYGEINNCSPYTSIVTGLVACFLSDNAGIARQERFSLVKEYLDTISFAFRESSNLLKLTLYKT